MENGRAERARRILERAPSFWKETLHLKVGFAFLWKRARSRDALVREVKPWTPERISRDNGHAERARGIQEGDNAFGRRTLVLNDSKARLPRFPRRLVIN